MKYRCIVEVNVFRLWNILFFCAEMESMIMWWHIGLLPGWVGSKSWPAGCILFFRLVGWSAVVLMLGLMDLFATAFISFTSKNWQAVKWNFGLDFQLDCLETFVKIFVVVLQQPQALCLSQREEKLFTVRIFLSKKESLSWGQSCLVYTIRSSVFMTVCAVWETYLQHDK